MTQDDPRGLTIGEFGRRAGLSIKAFRSLRTPRCTPPSSATTASTPGSCRRTTPWHSVAGTDPFVLVAQPVADTTG